MIFSAVACHMVKPVRGLCNLFAATLFLHHKAKKSNQKKFEPNMAEQIGEFKIKQTKERLHFE